MRDLLLRLEAGAKGQGHLKSQLVEAKGYDPRCVVLAWEQLDVSLNWHAKMTLLASILSLGSEVT